MDVRTLAKQLFTPDRACLGIPTDEFFPEQGGSEHAAKRICNQRCPLKDVCLEFALALAPHESRGIWGGTNETERARIRIARNPVSSPEGAAAAKSAHRKTYVANNIDWPSSVLAQTLNVAVGTVEHYKTAIRREQAAA